MPTDFYRGFRYFTETAFLSPKSEKENFFAFPLYKKKNLCYNNRKTSDSPCAESAVRECYHTHRFSPWEKKEKQMEKKEFGFRKDAAKTQRRDRPRKNEGDRRFSSETEVPENVIFGRNAVRELLASERDIDKIYIQAGEREGSVCVLLGEAAARKIPIHETDRQKLDQLSGHGAHQGIVAFAAERNYSSIEEILAYAAERGEAPFLILCDGIEDPGNLGAVIRSAECLGAHGVVIPKRRAVGLSATVAKASAGAIEYMRVARVTNLSQAMEELKEKGVWIYGTDMGGTPYDETDFHGAVALVLGSEGSGMSRLVRETCDFTVSIPMCGHIDSMNVSAAGAVVMAEVARQRRG